jgi:hypothetical protein
MYELVADVPGALGAVLTDHEGDAVDFVHRDPTLSEFDIEVTGSQIGQAVARTDGVLAGFGLGSPTIVLETRRRIILAGLVARSYVLALVLARPANLAQALRSFRLGLRRTARLVQ